MQTVEALEDDRAARVLARLGRRNIVLVGMMGAGKTSVGRRLARTLSLPFRDADAEIEKAANLTIAEIFDTYGELHFRDGERRVIARLVTDGPKVIATGGGAFMSAQTRATISANGVSVWLKADLPLLMDRVRRKSDRPLLRQSDPAGTMRRLLAEREPLYAEADVIVASRDTPHQIMVADILTAVEEYFDQEDGSA